jgi:hypothetical protein
MRRMSLAEDVTASWTTIESDEMAHVQNHGKWRVALVTQERGRGVGRVKVGICQFTHPLVLAEDPPSCLESPRVMPKYSR